MEFFKPKKLIWAFAFLFVITSCVKEGEQGESVFDVAVDPPVVTPTPTIPPVTDGEFKDRDFPIKSFESDIALSKYRPAGVGGGGAMSGLSISPFSTLWFVGTDMGTLFRSVDFGKNWRAVHHLEAVFSPDIDHAVSVGFSPNPDILFHAPGGLVPLRSKDGGKTWDSIEIKLKNNEFIKYWRTDSFNENLVLCGTTKGLFTSQDAGLTWEREELLNAEAMGSFIDYKVGGHRIYHATKDRVYLSDDQAQTWNIFYNNPGIKLRGFTGGRDKDGLTFAFLDNNGKKACSWAEAHRSDWGDDWMNTNYRDCGYVWVGSDDGVFSRKDQYGGDHIKMAENDSKTIYVTGGRYWVRQYGTKVWKSTDRGLNFDLKLFQYNWDVTPYEPWDQTKIEASAPAIEQGWWDDGYESFTVNQRDSTQVGGSGYFFLHTSIDGGETWKAPFTKYADTGEKVKGKKWESVGLEVTTAYRFKFHPNNPQLGYVSMADIGGLVTEDAGKTFRIAQAAYNSNFDHAFDPADDNIVYAASGNHHDFPEGWHAEAIRSTGGIYKSDDRGHNWTRLTPVTTEFDRQYLSVAYDKSRNTLYGGTQSTGMVRSTDGGSTWEVFNKGLPVGDLIVPQIELDPLNGNAYIIITGDYPRFTNREKTGIYFLDVQKGSDTWEHLRGSVKFPTGEVDPIYELWYYPIAFAVDFSVGSDRSTIWMADYENNLNWLATGIWKSTDRGENWERKIQYTHPTSIILDQENPDNIYLNGRWQVEGTWGDGGLIYSTDGGESWKKNADVPLQANGYNTTLDPNDPDKIFYTFFGNALMHGPKPR
ncbi:MAG: photosystem II stability/assembly factor-like uncharacterized protein [Bacteriovoracaceae bacterium]|jgi:photosystem II stability/assembly factor-like uncharacterized protein